MTQSRPPQKRSGNGKFIKSVPEPVTPPQPPAEPSSAEADRISAIKEAQGVQTAAHRAREKQARAENHERIQQLRRDSIKNPRL